MNWNFGNKLILFISSDSCHKMMLLKSLNTSLSGGTHVGMINDENVSLGQSCTNLSETDPLF